MQHWFKWVNVSSKLCCLTHLRSIFPSYRNQPIDLQCNAKQLTGFSMIGILLQMSYVSSY